MDRLTPRQLQVVELACDGDLTRVETAERLGIHEGSVRNHRTEVLRRLESHSMNRVCALWGRHQERRASAEVIAALREVRAMRAEQV